MAIFLHTGKINLISTLKMIFLSLYNMIHKFFKGNTNRSVSETIYFDFETTGLNPFHNKIIEYSFLPNNNIDMIYCECRGEFCKCDLYGTSNFLDGLVNPECKFEKKITDITNIHPDDLHDKPTISDVINDIISFINYKPKIFSNKNVYLVAHNCDGFDKLFLQHNVKRAYEDDIISEDTLENIKKWKYIDTLILAKKLLPDLQNYSLKSLSKYFKITPGSHRALDDCKCLQKIYHKLLTILSSKINRGEFYLDLFTDDFIDKVDLLDNPEIVYKYIYI